MSESVLPAAAGYQFSYGYEMTRGIPATFVVQIPSFTEVWLKHEAPMGASPYVGARRSHHSPYGTLKKSL